MNPADELLTTVFKMEKEFIVFHGTCDLNKASNVMKTLLKILKLKYISIDEVVISCYIRILTYIRMKTINKKRSLKRYGCLLYTSRCV